MADLQVVMEKLQGFETEEDLADYLHDYGIVARPRQARSCAIAKFVKIETGLDVVVVNSDAVRIENVDGFTTGSFRHTNAMANFVANYDRGWYPELVEEGYEIAFQHKCCEDCG